MSENIDAELLKDDAAETEESTETHEESESDFGGTQVSQGPGSAQGVETAQGGADAVPDTPDDVAEVHTGETDATRRQG